MELFETLPSNLFTILTSKNRSVYANSLLIIHQAFKQDIIIDKEILTNQLISKLENDIFDIDVNAEDVKYDGVFKDASSLGRYIIRRLGETGWLDIDYENETKLREYVSLPPYSIKLISIISDLTNNEVKEYDSFMYAMYSSLLNADQNYQDYRYTALTVVYDKVVAFEESLKGLFHNLKRRYTNLLNLKTVNQVLYEHFDSYQHDLIMNIYMPLKTKDSITRFKGSIFGILIKWLRDKDTITTMTNQAMVANRFKTEELAQGSIISKINYIVDKLNELEDLVIKIDERNNNYVSAAAEKMHHLLSSDRSITGKLSKIIAKISGELKNGFEDSLNLVISNVTLHRQETVNEGSLYTRNSRFEKLLITDPLPLNVISPEAAKKMQELFQIEAQNRFSHQSLIDFMSEQFNLTTDLNSTTLKIDNQDQFILTMMAFIRGFDDNLFYRMKINDGRVDNNGYQLPNLEFYKRR
jgi:hypothetical protein